MKQFLSIALLCLLLLLCGCNEKTCIHADADSNTFCDNCGDSVIIEIDVCAINDLHGKILDGSTHPGVDELTTYLRNLQASSKHVLLLSAGDMWQGSAESNLTRGNLMTDWMNELDFAAMTMGNHEYDWGEEPIAVNAELAEFPLLAINIYDVDTNQPVSYCQPSVMVEYDCIQIGIIGAIGDCYSSIASEKVTDVYFKTGHALTELVKAESEKLRAEGADFIIYILHDGLGQSSGNIPVNVDDGKLSSYYSPSLSEGYVDLVFEGHTHQQYILVDEQGVYHLQNGGDNNGFSRVQLEINSVTGETSVTEATLVACSEYDMLEDDPFIQELLESYSEEIGTAFDVLATIPTSRPGDTLRQLVADLYYMAGIQRWGSEYDIVLGGGFISIRDPGYLAGGEVTYAELQGLFPFDNELVLCSIKGRDLKDRFLESDNSSYFICCGSYGEEVMDNLDPNATYYVVVDTYSSTYAPNKLTEIERYGEEVYARDLLAEFIQAGGMS